MVLLQNHIRISISLPKREEIATEFLQRRAIVDENFIYTLRTSSISNIEVLLFDCDRECEYEKF